jgi:hypothetical protein
MVQSTDDQDFRRALSGNDAQGKKGCNIFRRVLSDATNENSSRNCSLDGEEICEPTLQYCELVTIAGVSDIPEICRTDQPISPPAAPVMGRAARSISATANAKAVISIYPPHQLLIVTKEFRDLFGYTVDSEICGRALRNLYGPRTDPKTIASSMRSVAMINSASHSVVLYNRDGEGSEFNAMFTPFLSDAETLAGCLLELSAVKL